MTSIALFALLLAGDALARPPQPAEKPAIPATAARPAPKRDLVALKILGPRDIARYRDIFALQEDGRWRAADALIGALDDDILLGHVRYQRYMHPTRYRSRFNELEAWLQSYGGHPGARKIYRLALRRRPKGARRPPRATGPAPIAAYGVRTRDVAAPLPRKAAKGGKRLRGLARRLYARAIAEARRNRPDRAARISESKDARRIIPRRHHDTLRARIAQAYFRRGNDAKAFAIAAKVANRSRTQVWSADWIAGLTAWKLGRIGLAQGHFEALSQSDLADDWNRSAGAFWAARAHLVGRQPDKVVPLLQRAAAYPRTFHGQIAARVLGLPPALDFRLPPLSRKDLANLTRSKTVLRAIALSEVGRHDQADRELRALEAVSDRTIAVPLMALAGRLGLAAIQYRLARAAKASGGPLYDAALYPIPPWQPEDGFDLDPALLFALMRQESGFKSNAKSPAGARGLMQLMPNTASFIARDRSLRRGNRARLYDPGFNLALGQDYVRHLLQQEQVAGDLFKLAVAYNSGPGNLNKWLRRTRCKDDPLLFIECIPARETRLFVERVLTNYWIYRSRMDRATPSLDAVASGRWPAYGEQHADPVDLAGKQR